MAVLAFDHVIVVVTDLQQAAARLLEESGLAAVAGGRHRGHGTGNLIVPLGSAYLELMAVVDRSEAETSPLGRWVAARDEGVALVGLRTDDIEAVSRRLGLAPMALSRLRPAGGELAWRLVGLDQAMAAGLPFFIACDFPMVWHPGQETAGHRVRPFGISWVELGGDPERLAAWLGPHDLDLRAVTGEPGLRRAAVTTDVGEIVL